MAIHRSVLLQEATTYLNVRPGELYIDATYGAGGHSREILARGGKVLALDVSPEAVETAEEDPRLKIVLGNFRNLGEIARREGFDKVAGILFDLGISSDELESIPGLSFQRDEPLDMRLDPSLGVTAADLLNALPESKLVELFSTYGEEPASRKLAAAIVRARTEKKFERTSDLLQTIESVKGSKRFGQAHPATQVFQALRIAVNDELDALKAALPQAAELLNKGGRLVVISFHSGEDRIVKKFLTSSALNVLTPKPITPAAAEKAANPRSRSGKLRAAEKT